MVRVGTIPEEFASVIATVQAVFVANATDLGRCYPEVFTGPHKPTPTPIPPPVGECHRSATISFDLADVNESLTLGNLEVPVATSAHAVVLTELHVTHQNGSAIKTVRGLGGEVVFESAHAPKHSHRIVLGIRETDRDVDYEYMVVAQQSDSAS